MIIVPAIYASFLGSNSDFNIYVSHGDTAITLESADYRAYILHTEKSGVLLNGLFDLYLGQESYLDPIPPEIALRAPINTTYISANISVDYSATDNLEVYTCWYQWNNRSNSVNISMPSCENTSFIGSEGYNNLTVFAEDFGNNVAGNTTEFTIDTLSPVTTDDSEPGIHWHSNDTILAYQRNITFNIIELNSVLNKTYYCVYNYSQTPCTNWTILTPINSTAMMSIMIGADSARQLSVSYFSEANYGDNESVKTSNKIFLVRGSDVDDLTNATLTDIKGHSVVRESELINSTLNSTMLISSFVLNSSTDNSTIEGSNLTNAKISSCTLVHSNTLNSVLTTSSGINGGACYFETSDIQDSIADRSLVNSSEISNSNISRSEIADSVILNSLVQLSTIDSAMVENLTVYGARIEGDILISGKIIYNNLQYYGPFNISKIYASVPPVEYGTLAANQSVVKNGTKIYMTYRGGVGYTASLDISQISSSSVAVMNDAGSGMDVVANDGIYTSPEITIASAEGSRIISGDISDALGNGWNVSLTIIVDDTAPEIGDFSVIYPIGQTEVARDQFVTIIASVYNATSVSLNCSGMGGGFQTMTRISSTDNYSAQCIANSPVNGEFTIYAYDQAGNLRIFNSSVSIDLTPPDSVENLSAEVLSRSVNLSWSNVSGDTRYYRIYRSISPSVSKSSGNLIGNTTQLVYSETLNSSGTFFYAVSAVDDVSLEGELSNIANISISAEPGMPYGTLSILPIVARDTAQINMTFAGSDIGYTISLNTSAVDSAGDLLNFTDNHDGTYVLRFNISAGNSKPDGDYRLNVSVQNSYQIFHPIAYLHLDNTVPNGSMSIVGMVGVGFTDYNRSYSGTRQVYLNTSFEDDYGVDKCRFANEDRSFTEWAECQKVKSWLLSLENGQKIVIMQIKDSAGNIFETNGSILLNTTGVGLDTTAPVGLYVVDDGAYTNSVTSMHVAWFNASDHESDLLAIPLSYEYSIGTVVNSTDVLAWTNSGGLTDLTITGINLSDENTYYVNVRAINTVALTDVASSDGITIDTNPPSTPSIISSVSQAVWTAVDSVNFSWNSSDALSGVNAYSFILDQSNTTVPSAISSADDSVIYSGLGDGTFVFHVRARDNATNWGSQRTYAIYIDNSAPSTPRMSASQDINSTTGTFNWSQSSDISGITDYYLEVGTTQGGADILAERVGNVTSKSITGLISGTTYYVRVKAENGAALWSSFSDTVSNTIDVRAPIILFKRPSGLVSNGTIDLFVMTDEPSICSYRSSPILAYSQFAYTGSYIHDQQINKVMGTNNYQIQCTDLVGNSNTSSIDFTALSGISLDMMNFESASGNVAGQLGSFILNMTSGGTGVGELDVSSFDVRLTGFDNLLIDDKNVFDMGAGRYNVSFVLPLKSGAYTLNITYSHLSISQPLAVVDLNLTVLYGGSGLSPKSQSNVVYSAAGNHMVGIASDSKDPRLSGGSTNISTSSRISKGASYIFVTGADADVVRKNDYLKQGTFSTQVTPTFGSVLNEKNTVRAELSYGDISIIGNDSFSTGDYRLNIQNIGFNATSRKTILNITVLKPGQN